MLVFNLKREWYEKIKSGEKTIEYREVKPYWTKRMQKNLLKYCLPTKVGESKYLFGNYPCILRLGYTKKYMTANICKIKIMNGLDTDLKIDKKVYAIYLVDIK